MSSAEERLQQQETLGNEKDKILSFENFGSKVNSISKLFKTNKKEDEVSLYLIDFDERRISIFLKFRRVRSPFGFLQLVLAEKEGIEVAKNFSIYRKSVFYTSGHNF